jgi:ABC-2 type transport system ATP-binding protein
MLFLDEPTTGLDPQARAHLWDAIRRFREQGTTVFLTTHYLDEADALVDRLAIIDHGRIVAEGSPELLKREVGGDVVTLGVDGSAELVRQLVETQPYVRESTVHEGAVRLFVDRRETALPALLRVLGDAGLAPDTVGVAGPSLDDVFLRHTGRSLRDEAA